MYASMEYDARNRLSFLNLQVKFTSNVFSWRWHWICLGTTSQLPCIVENEIQIYIFVGPNIQHTAANLIIIIISTIRKYTYHTEVELKNDKDTSKELHGNQMN